MGVGEQEGSGTGWEFCELKEEGGFGSTCNNNAVVAETTTTWLVDIVFRDVVVCMDHGWGDGSKSRS